MRPPTVYANRSCSAGCSCDLLGLLAGRHRVGYRLVMILLSQRSWPPAAIAELLGCDAATVRRWIHPYNHDGVAGLADRPRAGRPRLGSPRLGKRIGRLLAQPKAWTINQLYQQLGRPAMSLRTLHRRVREVAAWRRPRLVAKGDPDRDQVLADLQARAGGVIWLDLGHLNAFRRPLAEAGLISSMLVWRLYGATSAGEISFRFEPSHSFHPRPRSAQQVLPHHLSISATSSLLISHPHSPPSKRPP